MTADLFTMPLSSISILLAVAFGLAEAVSGSLPIMTASYKADQWSPRPTKAPEAPAKIFKRSSVDQAVCGWIGGDSAKPQQCSAGSSCIHDTSHGYVGCCSTEGPCTQGVYTTCMDTNSPGWQSTASLTNNGITTCSSASLCYTNSYPGSYSQWVCGDAASATTIQTSFSGQPTDVRLQVVFTGVNFGAMASAMGGGTPITLDEVPGATSTTGDFSSDTGASAGKVSAVNAGQPASALGNSGSNASTIAGGTIACIAGVALIAAVAYWCLRRRSKRKTRARRSSSFFDIGRNEPYESEFIRKAFRDEASSREPLQGQHTSPLTSNPSNATRNRDLTSTITHTAKPSFSTVARQNPFEDEEPPPVPQVSGTFTNIAASNPIDDIYDLNNKTPALQPNRYAQPPHGPPSPTPPEISREQKIPLVAEIEDFSRSWSSQGTRPTKNTFSSTFHFEDPDVLGPKFHKGAPDTQVLDRKARPEEARQMGRSENVRMEGWQPRQLQTHINTPTGMRQQQAGPRNTLTPERPFKNATDSEVSSLRGPDRPFYNPTDSGVSSLHSPNGLFHNSTGSGVSSMRGAPVPVLKVQNNQARLPHPLAETTQAGAGRGRENSESSLESFSSEPAYTRQTVLSTRSINPMPPLKSPTRDDKRTSFDLNGTIRDVISDIDGQNDSGHNNDGLFSGWGGLGGGWLEGQSGMFTGEDISLLGGPAKTPILDGRDELESGLRRKGTFGT